MAATKAMSQLQIDEQKIGFPDDALERLTAVDKAMSAMMPDERSAALSWMKSKFRAEWPSDLS